MLTSREILGWGGAGAVVIAAHVFVSYGVAAWTPPREQAAVEPAMIVELAPLVISEAEPVEVETVDENEPETVEEVSEAVEETEPQEQPEEVTEAEPDEEQVEEAAPAPPVKRAEVVLPKREKPKPVKKAEPKAEPKPKPVKRAGKPAPKKAAPQKTEARTATKAATGSTGPKAKAASVNPSRWYAQVQAAVLRSKPRGRGAAGSVVVKFVVSSSGTVTSASLGRSSGNPELDRAALSMVRGARIPRPPEGLGRSSFPFSVPVRFE